jgi:hypothetical protein
VAGEPACGGEARFPSEPRVYWRRDGHEVRGVLPGEICWAPRVSAVAPRTKERRAMTQQKSERCVVPKARRKPSQTEGSKRPRGGKAAPVEQQTLQLGLSFETAENPTAKAGRIAREAGTGRPVVAAHAVPKSKSNEEKSTSVMMDAVCSHLRGAFRKVASNKGAPGPDRQSVEEVRAPRRRAGERDRRAEVGDVRAG